MIKFNGEIITQDKFGDGTLKCSEPNAMANPYVIKWFYEDDKELFTLCCLVDHIRDFLAHATIHLEMPYIPHARQDRKVGGKLFTLKSFAKIINSLSFDSVTVHDPHSDVSLALFNNLIVYGTSFVIDDIPEGTTFVYPDAGAAKRYHHGSTKAIYGNKTRNSEGRIISYELINFINGTKRAIVRDDICSYGGTFAAVAKELRARGVEHITLAVTHCENNILKGEVLDLVDEVYTTDSIFTAEHPKIKIARRFREE